MTRRVHADDVYSFVCRCVCVWVQKSDEMLNLLFIFKDPSSKEPLSSTPRIGQYEHSALEAYHLQA